jgi:hypothetical protein
MCNVPLKIKETRSSLYRQAELEYTYRRQGRDVLPGSEFRCHFPFRGILAQNDESGVAIESRLRRDAGVVVPGAGTEKLTPFCQKVLLPGVHHFVVAFSRNTTAPCFKVW